MPRKIAILDTNILDYGFKTEYAESVVILLSELSINYDLVTTQYSRFELFRGMLSSRIPAAKSFFQEFACIEIDGEVFKIAAALSTCYKNDDSTKSRASSFTDGDIIIGAAGFVNDASIITANLNDFPCPYFIEVTPSTRLVSKRSGRLIAVGILKPDVTYLNENLSLHYPPATEDVK